MIKVVIFDFDGTMFDTAPEIHQAVNMTLKDLDHHQLSFEEVTHCIGQGLHYLIKSLNLKLDLSPDGIENITRLFRNHYEKILLNSHPYPGLLEFLNEGTYQVAVASNKDEKYIKIVLNQTPWNSFLWLALNGGNTFKTKKPEPEMVLDILKKANCQPHEAVIVGDGIPDVEVAKNSGIHCMAVSYGYSPLEELMSLGATSSIDSLFELPAALKKL